MGITREQRFLKFSASVKNRLLRNRLIVLITLSIVITGFLILPLYKYQINPDGISYISIAEKYSHGDFRDAINGYWGPLLSWMIVPGLWLGIDPIVSIKILQVLLTGVVIALVYKVLKRYANENVAAIGGLTIGIISLNWALTGPLTPDLLVLVLTLLLLVTFDTQHGYSTAKMAAIGVTGALLFFAKGAGLFLFLGIWGIWLVGDWLFGERRHLAALFRRRLLSIVVFVLLILPFVAAISLKSNHLTLGSSGRYNFALVGPHSVGHPMITRLFPPPNNTAVSIWEDISNVPITTWSPFQSVYNFKFFVSNINKNLGVLSQIIMQFGWIIFALGIFYIVKPSSTKKEERFKFVLGSTALLTTLLYLPIFVELRYIMFTLIAGLLGFMILMGEQYKQLNHKLLPLKLFGALLVTLLILSQVNGLRKAANINKGVRMESLSLSPFVAEGSRLAGDDFGTLYACYYIKVKCYGAFIPKAADTKQQIINNKIQYLILSSDSAKTIESSGLQIKKIDGPTYQGRYLYAVNNAQQLGKI
jgi:hypothetical protein